MPDIASLINPISEDNPCGEDMSLSTEFDAIAEARRSDDPSLEQGDWVKDLKIADWQKVESLCSGLLSDKTKDIRVCVWLIEAWATNDGFSGIASGYDLLAQLCATDWENLHPLPDDGDEEARINNMARLLELSEPLVKAQPLTQSEAGEFSYFELESARYAARQSNNSDDDGDGEVDNRLAQFESARRDTPKEFYAEQLADIGQFSEALTKLEEVLDERLGIDAPSFGSIRETLDEVHRLVHEYAQDAGVLEQGSDAKPAGSEQRQTEAMAAAGSAQGPIKTRAQAITQLRRVAEFFRRTEPHSPVAYLADKAAHWGDMPLHSWLRSVMRDDGELAHMEELLGLTSQRQRGGGEFDREEGGDD